MRYIVTIITAGVLCLLSFIGCSFGPETIGGAGQHGGDDFPNMVTAAGKEIAENLDQQWENPAEASKLDISVVEQANNVFSTMGSSLGKKLSSKGTNFCDSLWFTIDSSRNRMTIFTRTCTETSIKHDTLIIKGINMEGADVVSLSGATVQTVFPYDTNRYWCEDIDGDSVVFSNDAGVQQARVTLLRITVGGRVETVEIGIDAGEDGVFDADETGEDDNAILFISSMVTEGEDTLSLISVKDADGDGFVAIGKEVKDSSIADIVFLNGNNGDNQLLRNSRTVTRMVVFPGDSSRDYAIRYGVTNRYLTRTVDWVIQTIHGDSSFFPGDTVNIVRVNRFDRNGNDSCSADTLMITAILGQNPRDTADDVLTGIYLHSIFSSGDLREVFLKFTAETPVPNGQFPADGTFDFALSGEDGFRITIENGVISENAITAVVSTSDGESYAVGWNPDGTLQSIEKMN